MDFKNFFTNIHAYNMYLYDKSHSSEHNWFITENIIALLESGDILIKFNDKIIGNLQINFYNKNAKLNIDIGNGSDIKGYIYNNCNIHLTHCGKFILNGKNNIHFQLPFKYGWNNAINNEHSIFIG